MKKYKVRIYDEGSYFEVASSLKEAKEIVETYAARMLPSVEIVKNKDDSSFMGEGEDIIKTVYFKPKYKKEEL